MTATSRIFATAVKKKVEKLEDIQLFSMDDKSIFGNEFHRLNFAEAVEKNLLSDYKVLILTVTNENAANSIKDITDKEIELSDAAKIIGCWNGLAKRTSDPNALPEDERIPMKRAVAYAGRIDTSKQVKDLFNQVIQEYRKEHEDIRGDDTLKCEVEHTDGTENAMVRNKKLNWLKEDADDNICRILTNARCLSEGVDVPALDAVMFLSPRKSKIDIVQSVGRVMRRAPDKKMGYIILPVLCDTDVPPEEALNNNETYSVVWDTIQAIRSHDERMDSEINKIELNKKLSDRITIIGVDIPHSGNKDADTSINIDIESDPQLKLQLYQEEMRHNILATLVMKCGTRRYWQNWADGVASISQDISSRINSLVEDTDSKHHKKFNSFLKELRSNINPAITSGEAIEMLAQHIITAPVFNALFEDYSFVKNNPVSKSLDKFLEAIECHNLATEAGELEKFFKNAETNVAGIDNLAGKQKIITELYENFFKKAFKKQADRLGIVYTPVEIVDFILNSADDLLHKHFGKRLTSKGVNILDPFTGTGTFISRLLQLGLINKQDLARKYASELHANEIVLLAYYIAAINIEQTYHFCLQEEVDTTEETKEAETQKEQTQNSTYQQFPGITLTDTFQLNEDAGDYLKEAEFLQSNPTQIKKQKEQSIMVIVGNPPYSGGQKNQNDNNPNLKYHVLNERIRNTYAAHSIATNKNYLYDSYVRAIRWATDRIKDEGMVAFVTNGSFLDRNSMEGLRYCLQKELTHIYCFNLRGNIRKYLKEEGGAVFGSGSMATITITLLIKAPADKTTPKGIYYSQVADYLTSKEKLEKLQKLKSVNSIKWQKIQPDKNNDWLNQRDPKFSQYIPLGTGIAKSYFIKNLKHLKTTDSIFGIYSAGLKTNRDVWVYNYNKQEVIKNMQSCIKFYNIQVQDFHAEHADQINNLKLADKIFYMQDFIQYDSTKIHWDVDKQQDLAQNKKSIFDKSKIRIGLYLPFCKQHVYFDKQWNNRQYRLPKLFPQADSQNMAICVPHIADSFDALMIDVTYSSNIVTNCQSFPRYCFNTAEGGKDDLLSQTKGSQHYNQEQRIDNISPQVVKLFQQQYKDNSIDADALFYYVYGILHSPAYRDRYANNLSKELPHIPYVATKKNFWLFSGAGKQLGEWHTNYEKHNPEPNIEIIENPDMLSKNKDFYRIEKMKFRGTMGSPDKSRIIYNHNITIAGIPSETYDYKIAGKSPLEWLLYRYQVTIDTGKGGHPGSGIKNDPNDWSDNPRYILDLIPRLAQLSIDTCRVISKLPDIPK